MNSSACITIESVDVRQKDKIHIPETIKQAG